MKKILIILILLFTATSNVKSTSATTPASAITPFTGSMNMALTMPNGSGTVAYLFGQDVQRMDMAMRINKIPDVLKTTVITKAAQPDIASVINHQAKNYSIVNLRTAAENALLLDFDSNYTLKKAGREMVKNYNCDHLILTSSTEKLELWVTHDLGHFSTFRILRTQNPRLSNTRLASILKEGNIEGFPVKMVQNNTNGTYRMELLSISKKPIPPALFTVPAGYQKIENNEKPLGNQQKAQLKNLMEKMKQFE